jgi:hypothetical protein
MSNGRIAWHDNGSRVTDDELFADDPELSRRSTTMAAAAPHHRA